MNTIKSYNHEDTNLPKLHLSYHSTDCLLVNASEFCENPKNPKSGIFGIREANEQVIKIVPCTLNISDDFMKAYQSEDCSSKGKEYCAYWKKNCEPYTIWGFYSIYRNYFPTESTPLYRLKLSDNENTDIVYYWTDPNTLVIQKVKAFKTLEQFVEKHTVINL